MQKQFLKDLAIYALPMFLARAIGLILLPIYTRYLGPKDFGFIEFAIAAITILLIVAPLEINQGMARLLPDQTSKKRELEILSSALFFNFVGITTAVLFCSLVLWLLDPNWEHNKLLDEHQLELSLYAVVFGLTNSLQIFFRFTNKAVISALLNLAIVLANVGLVMFFIGNNSLNISNYFVAQIASGCCSILIGAYYIWKTWGIPRKFFFTEDLWALLKYSSPLVLSSIGFIIGNTLDKFMIGAYLSLSDLGFYGAAVRLASIVAIGFSVMGSAITPIIYRNHKTPQTKHLLHRVFCICLIGLAAGLTIIVAFDDFIVELLLGQQFLPTSEFLYFVFLNVAIYNLYIFFPGMDLEKRTSTLSGINIFSGLLAAVLCVASVPAIGTWGAIISALTGSITRIMLYYHFSERTYPFGAALPLALFSLWCAGLSVAFLNYK